MRYKELKKIFLNKMKDNQFVIKGSETKIILDDYILVIELQKSNFGEYIHINVMVEYPSLMDENGVKGYYHSRILSEDFGSEDYCDKNVVELAEYILDIISKFFSTKNKFETMIKNDMDLLIYASLPMKEYFKSMKEEKQATIFKGILSKFRR